MMVVVSTSSQFDQISIVSIPILEKLDTKLCQLFVTNLSQKGVHFLNQGHQNSGRVGEVTQDSSPFLKESTF